MDMKSTFTLLLDVMFKSKEGEIGNKKNHPNENMRENR